MRLLLRYMLSWTAPHLSNRVTRPGPSRYNSTTFRTLRKAHMALPLEGMKVLDLSNIMAGPYCTMVLGDMGAEVVKVENFPEGDGSRRFDPKVNGESYCFAVLNRNKRSLALNMKDPRGKEIF